MYSCCFFHGQIFSPYRICVTFYTVFANNYFFITKMVQHRQCGSHYLQSVDVVCSVVDTLPLHILKMMFGVSHLSASSSELLARKSALKSLLVRAVASRIRPRTRTTQITAHIRPLSFSLQTHLSSPAGLLEYSEAAAEDVQGFRVLPDFVSTSEEQSLLKEVARALRRSKYQYDHWDGVRMWIWDVYMG